MKNKRSIHRICWFFILSLNCLLLSAAQPGEYVGAETCGGCHADIFSRESSSAHALTLHTARMHPLADSFFSVRSQYFRKPYFIFDFSLTPQDFSVRISDGKERVEVPIEWAFGRGSHGVTFVSRIHEGVYLEHAFSYYSDTQTLDITPGQGGFEPKTVKKAAGIIFEVDNPSRPIQQCFQCHSTGPVRILDGGKVQPAELGVRCEVCHGPGRAHLEAVVAGDVEMARERIVNPSHLPAQELIQECGVCHRFPGAEEQVNWENPDNTRHQPAYLRESRCFQRSGGQLSCLTCHDLHGPRVHSDPAYYSERCVSCHNVHKHPPQAVCEMQQPLDCIRCHMPVVQAVNRHFQFRNHWIGVYENGAVLKPSR